MHFEAAVDLGVDGVELDVRRTIDGVLVVHHDPSVDGRAIAESEPFGSAGLRPDTRRGPGTPWTVSASTWRSRTAAASASATTKPANFARQVLPDDRRPRLEPSASASRVSIWRRARSCDRSNRDLSVAWLLWDVAVGDALVQAHVLGFNAVNPHFSTVERRRRRARARPRARRQRLDRERRSGSRADDGARGGVHHHRRSGARASGRDARRPRRTSVR